MIINDCALSPQNAPGAINTRWVRTATIFKGLSGSFPVPPALIRPSHLPPFSTPLALLIVCPLTGKTKEWHSLSTTLECPHCGFALTFTLCLHGARPASYFLSCRSGHHHTCPFLPMLWIWKGFFKCSFVFQTLYSLYFKNLRNLYRKNNSTEYW